jgi:hypothetical protein
MLILLRFQLCLAIGFLFFFSFDLFFFKGVQNSIALHAQIYLITTGLGGWQAQGGNYADFVEILVMLCYRFLVFYF